MIDTILAFVILYGMVGAIIGGPILIGVLLAEDHYQRDKEKRDAEFEKFKSDHNIG